MKDVILKPRISEKAYGLSQQEGIKTYVFEVPAGANKHSVARAINEQYEVSVTSVRVLNVKGKAKQSYRKGSRPITGKRNDIKKAYITLAEGQSLPLFVEEAKEQEKQAKAEAKAAKKAEKESK